MLTKKRAASAVTLLEAFDLWREAENPRGLTARRYYDGLRRLSRVGLRVISDATVEKIDAVQRTLLARGHHPNHVRTEFGEAGSCKTGPRTVPVCAELGELLRERLPARGSLFPATRGPKAWRQKTPFLSSFTLERGIRGIRTAEGLADDLTFTVLRHTRASWWLQGGASIYKVADWMGHTVAVCEEYYGSLTDGYDPECERMPS